jgi:cytochrome c peroxidase
VLIDPDGLPAIRQRKVAPWPARGDGAAAHGDLRALRPAPTPAGWVGVLAGDDLLQGVPRLAELGAGTILVSASWGRGDAVDWNDLAASLAATWRVNLVVSNLVEPGQEPGIFVALVGETGEVSRLLPPAGSPVSTVSLTGVAGGPPAVVPQGLPPAPRPAAAPSGPAAVELGRRLFFDPVLSADGSVSCSSCHQPELALADGRRVSEGLAGRAGQRNTPSLLNVAYRPYLFWEGRARTLEEQVRFAVQGWFEMAGDPAAALERLRRDPSYRRDFQRATGRDDFAWDDVAAALASFERTLLSGGSPFDRWYYGGDETALSASARRGFKVFAGAGRCSTCHAVGERGALFADGAFHNTGIGYQPRFEYLGYGGDGVEGNLARDNSFRGEYLTPTLRNVALTGPYMHDGSLATLREVVDFYDRGGIVNPHLDPELRPLALSERDKEDLVAFLRALTGDQPAVRDGSRRLALLRSGGPR